MSVYCHYNNYIQCILINELLRGSFSKGRFEVIKQPWEFSIAVKKQQLFFIACCCVVYPYVLKPVCLVNSGVPVGFIYGGINHILHLPQRLPHHMNVGDFQEVQFHIWVETLTFIPSILCLHVVEAAEVEETSEGKEKEIKISQRVI